MKVLVTGSKGFLGKHLVKFLKNKGIQTISFDLIDGQDLLDKKALEEVISKAKFVLHLAAFGDVYKATKDPAGAAISGVGGTANIYLIANKYPVKKIIYASTWEVYGEPHYQPLDEKHPCFPDHPYSISKYGGELMLRSKLNNTPWIILRLGSAYGTNMRPNAAIPLFINKALRGEEIVLQGGGNQIRQFTHTEDICDAFYKAVTVNIRNEIFNIASPEIVTIKEIAKMINNYIPVKTKCTPARIGDISPSKVSSEKAKKILKWKAKIRFKEGLKEVINFYKNSGK